MIYTLPYRGGHYYIGGGNTDIYGSHFTYNGTDSSRYGLVIANLDTSRNTGLIGGGETVSMFNRHQNRIHYISTTYDEKSMLNFDIDIVTDDGSSLSVAQQKEVQKWLFSTSGFNELFFSTADDCTHETYDIIDGAVRRYFLRCRFTAPERHEYNDGIIGYKCTMECDSPVAWQEPITKTFTPNLSYSSTETLNYTTISVPTDSDLPDYIYPTKVKITAGTSGGTIVINNTTDSTAIGRQRLTKFVGLPANAVIEMNSSVNSISGSYYNYLEEKNFIRLLSGANSIYVAGNIYSIEFVWNNMKYM